MSTLIGLRLDNTAILATDSRTVDNTGEHILSDAEQKIFEVAPGTFYGWSGYGFLANSQVETAIEIAKTAAPDDLHGLADALDELSRPLMAELLDILRGIRHLNPKYDAELSGVKPFHAYILAGTSEGRPGFLARQFCLIDGSITQTETDGFRLPAGQNFCMYATYGELLGDLVPRQETWARGPVVAVAEFVDHIRHKQPLVGGPTQLVCLDQSGARWVHRLAPGSPAPGSAQLAVGQLAAGVVYAGTVNANQVHAGTLTGITVTATDGTNSVTLDSANCWVRSQGQYNQATLTQGGLVIRPISGNNPEVRISVDGLLAYNTQGALVLQLEAGVISHTGTITINGSRAFTGTIPAGKSLVVKEGLIISYS